MKEPRAPAGPKQGGQEEGERTSIDCRRVVKKVPEHMRVNCPES